MNSPDFYGYHPSAPVYIIPFDSEHPLPEEAERMQATAVMREVVENKLLEMLPFLSDKSRNADVFSEVILDSFDLDGEPVEVKIHSADTSAHPDLPQYTVSLSEGPRYIDGTYMRRHDYTISDAVTATETRRRDVKLEPMPKLNIDIGKLIQKPTEPRRIDPEVFEKLIKVFEDVGEKIAQERELGLNDQPIGVFEARQIALIVSRATLKIDPPRNEKHIPPSFL